MMDYIALHWQTVLVAVAFAVAVAGIGGVLTEIGPWYNSLRFPSWKPPNWAFGPVWTVILTLASASAVLAWVGAPSSQWRMGLVALFVANGVLNVLWNVLFFKLRRPDWALIETACLWLSILALIVFIWPVSQTASLLLAPYIAWVTIASALNLAIVRLNAPFTGVAEHRTA